MPTRQDSEIRAKLRNLKKNIERNEEQMRKAAIDYEGLLAERETLSAAVADLKQARDGRRREAGQASGRKAQ